MPLEYSITMYLIERTGGGGGGGGRLNIEILSYLYWYFHYKNEMVSRQSYLYNGNPHKWTERFLIWDGVLIKKCAIPSKTV